MFSFLKRIPVFIYDFFISTFLTISAHLSMLEYMTFSKGNLLDVGCGTGTPLKQIIAKLESEYTKIIGVDLHPQYTQNAKQLFKSDPRVEIHNVNFYDIKSVTKDRKFSTVFFSFSFMLMPDHVQALLLAQSLLQEEGKVSFLMTLNKKPFPLLEKFKPYIKKLTTVDFGNVIYERQFEEVLNIANLEVVKKVRIWRGLNPLFWIFPVNYIECKIKD